MRKIETAMIGAITSKSDWTNTNTSVEYSTSENLSEIRLHGHLIAWYDHTKQSLGISSCGYETVTTKSRLNALLYETFTGNKVVQKDYVWYVQDFQGKKINFYDGQIVTKHGASSIATHPNVA